MSNILYEKMKLGNLEIKGFTALAPLAGITDIAFRIICRELGASVVFSEMVSSEGIVRSQPKTMRYLNFLEEEQPVALQIFGARPEVMAEAAQMIVENKAPDIIDINFGCPVKKVVRNNAGSALLKEPEKVGRIAEAVAKAVDIPVTVKIRSGWDENTKVIPDIGIILEEAGAAAITHHARTRKQLFTGKARWDDIRELKENVSIPVIGNGDIATPEDALEMMKSTGCDMVMIGRGCMGNPWIFGEIEEYLANNNQRQKPDMPARIDVCLRQIRLSLELYGEHYASNTMKKHVGWYVRGLPGNAAVKQKVFTSTCSSDMISFLEDYRDYLAEYRSEDIRRTAV